MKVVSGLLTISTTLLVLATVGMCEDFEPIPEADKDLYTFDLEKNFYASEVDFEADLEALTRDIEKLESLKGTVASSPQEAQTMVVISRLFPAARSRRRVARQFGQRCGSFNSPFSR